MIYSNEARAENATSTSTDEKPIRPLPLLEETALLTAHRVSDTAGQLLANTIFELAACVQIMDESPEVAKEGLVALENELRDGLRELRQFVFELNPPFLHKVGLVAALERYVERVAGQSETVIETNLDSDSRRSLRSMDTVPKTHEIAVFRIIQEALFNAYRHAGATHIGVTLQRQDECLTFIVEDDGEWQDPTTLPDDTPLSLSYMSMRERARLIDGELTITHGERDGARVELRVPWASLDVDAEVSAAE